MDNKRLKLEDQRYEAIMAHILHPEDSPLPVELRPQLDRVLTAARLMDRHPESSQIVSKLQAKYMIGRNTAYQDIRIARELFKQDHEFDFDFWKAWQIKDLLELIHECKLQGKHKEWANAHKILKLVIGEKPIQEEDPRRLEKNNIFIQLNNNKSVFNIPIDVVSKLSKHEMQQLSEAVYQAIDESEASDIMNS